MNWYIQCLKKYADFSGRARRMEYWMFVLVSVIIVFVIATLEKMFGYIPGKDETNIFIDLYFLAVLVPSIAVSVRRLHDIGKSGWWYFICFIPFLGWIWYLVLMCLDGTAGTNKYGAEPE